MASVYARSFGVQSLVTGAPVTPGLRFCLASNPKCFAATTVLQLGKQSRD
jgi:CubicO group peptidase (beta-lactamase class C family)